MAEAGVPDFEVTSWNALYGPKDMPQQAVDTLAQAATEILQRPDVIAQYKAIGFDARPIKAGALDQRMRFEIERWARVIAPTKRPKAVSGERVAYTGTRTVARRPPSGLSSRMMSPPWERAMSRAIASPSPLPPSSWL